jgi:hypothetical protein
MCSIFFLKMIKKIMKSNLPLKYNIKRRIDRVKSSLSQAVTFDSIVVEKMVFIIHPFFFYGDWGCCASHIFEIMTCVEDSGIRKESSYPIIHQRRY